MVSTHLKKIGRNGNYFPKYGWTSKTYLSCHHLNNLSCLWQKGFIFRLSRFSQVYVGIVSKMRILQILSKLLEFLSWNVKLLLCCPYLEVIKEKHVRVKHFCGPWLFLVLCIRLSWSIVASTSRLISQIQLGQGYIQNVSKCQVQYMKFRNVGKITHNDTCTNKLAERPIIWSDLLKKLKQFVTYRS